MKERGRQGIQRQERRYDGVSRVQREWEREV